MSLRLLLVRHGQSEWNAAGRWQGHADPPLSELGERQSADAVHVIDAVVGRGSVGRVVSSDLRRASRTAEIIAGGLALGPVAVEPRLRERDVGDWQGLTRADIDERWPGYLDAGRRPQGWESDESVLNRFADAIAGLRAEPVDDDVVVVTHGGVVHAVERSLGAEWVTLPNLGARWVEVEDGALRLGERVLLIDPDDVAVTVPRQL